MIANTLSPTIFKVLIAVGLLLSGCRSAISAPASKEEPASAIAVAAAPVAEDAAEEAPVVDLSQSVKATQPWKIVFVSGDQRYGEDQQEFDPYWAKAWQSLEQHAAELGVEVEQALIDAPCSQEDCAEAQIKLVNSLLEQGELDGIILGTVDSNRLVPIVDKVIAAGIPVITIDTDVNSGSRLTFVAMDNFSAGQLMGEWVVKQLGGQGTALILEGVSTQSNAIQRRDGFLAGLQSGDIAVLASKSGNWNADEAKEITKTWLEAFSEISVILSANDRMALGAAEAVAEASREGIMITGYDAIDDALIAIESGQMTASIDQGPDKQTQIALQLLVRHLETGEEFPNMVPLPEIPLITQENVGDYLAAQ